MNLTVLDSGAQLLYWPDSWAQFQSFVGRWGLLERTAYRALVLGWVVMQTLGLHLWIISGRRTVDEQRQLYEEAQRGERPYPVAIPGTSYHEMGRAFDLAGDRELTATEWRAIHQLAGQLGLSGATGDPPHFEDRGGYG